MSSGDRFAYAIGVDDLKPEAVRVTRRSNIESVFPASFVPVVLKEALVKAGIPHPDVIATSCEEVASENGIGNKEFQMKTMFIYAYTFDNWHSEPEKRAENPHRILNEALYKGDYVSIFQVRYFLWSLLVALRSLPYAKYDNLYRGLTTRVKWSRGDIKVWSAFTSMTLTRDIAVEFMALCKVEKEGTLICGRNLCGYDISRYSFFRNETEILLEPFQSVLVCKVEECDDYVYVDIEDTENTEPILVGRIPMGNITAPPPLANDVLEMMEQARIKQQSWFSRNKAIELFERAGSKGCNVAYFNIGNLYLFGVIVKRDKRAGISWWKMAGSVDSKDVWWMKTLSNDDLLHKDELDLGYLFCLCTL